MYPVAAFPDNKRGQYEKQVGSNKFKKRVLIVSNNAGYKWQAYTQYRNKNRP